MKNQFDVPVRICRQRRCPAGFYLLANGQRLWFKRHADAVESLKSLLSMQRFQVVPVTAYVERNRKQIAAAEKGASE